jgi:hypothetical protein
LLESIVIPRSIRSIDGSAFLFVTLSSISIESGNDVFVLKNDFLIDVLDHKLIRNFSSSSKVEIANDIGILGSHCFYGCKSLLSITFESNSRLTRIESNAFSRSSLHSILIPQNVEILGSRCFSSCDGLSSMPFESNSDLTTNLRLKVIPEEAFSSSCLVSVVIP